MLQGSFYKMPRALKPVLRTHVFSIVLLLWAVFEGVSFLELIYYPLSANGQSTVAGLDYDLFLLLAPFSPAVLLGVLYSRWIWAVISYIIRRSSSVRFVFQPFRNALESVSRLLGSSVPGQSVLGLNSRVLLSVSLTLAA